MQTIHKLVSSCKWLVIMTMLTYLFYQGTMMILESFQLINPYEKPKGRAEAVFQQIHHFYYEGE
ncbi:DUF4227 family protein [Rubeoparvulum massiliense]|uniref:DUF4227 family protein n=1 Tax=Rubeoparvulum massiliense TaxID=1631346 RepID=UPI00065E7DB9|nr:DUF4227 family protein [Rubeoparvulum massiliense]